MNADPELLSLKCTNCSQPRQFAFGDPEQAALVKVLVLICSEYALLTGVPELPMRPVSLVTLLMFSKCPIAWVMVPDGAPAEMSSPLPTTNGRSPRRGIIGMFGAVLHGISC